MVSRNWIPEAARNKETVKNEREIGAGGDPVLD